jgi:hypothetical protein
VVRVCFGGLGRSGVGVVCMTSALTLRLAALEAGCLMLGEFEVCGVLFCKECQGRGCS